MTTMGDLQPLVEEPMERLEVEYKEWLNLEDPRHRAVLAKAAIALANHGGGYIVIGMVEDGATFRSEPPPAELPEITQDRVNNAVHRFAEPAFHCGMRVVTRGDNGVQHPVIIVPGGMLVPVMSRRDQGPLRQYACYIRKPGPRSEEPNNAAEWRDLFNRCIRANRDEMLDAIRTIIEGRAQTVGSAPSIVQGLRDYCVSSRNRWTELVSTLPDTAPSRFPDGYWEMGLSLVGSIPATNLTEVRNRMDTAGRVMLNGWPLFLILNRQGLEPYSNQDCIEAWVGRPDPPRRFDDPQHSDFWRALAGWEDLLHPGIHRGWHPPNIWCARWRVRHHLGSSPDRRGTVVCQPPRGNIRWGRANRSTLSFHRSQRTTTYRANHR